MLILTRRVGEIFHIEIPELDAEISIAVTSINGNQAKIGISCPNRWNIVRDELRTVPTREVRSLADSRGNRPDSSAQQPEVRYKRDQRGKIPDPDK
jgi:carbon storage regulator CsrA